LTHPTEIELDGWQLTQEWAEEYLAAVGDAAPAYRERGLVPPLALAARTLGQLLEKLSLPPGAIHSLQELEVLAPLRPGQTVQGRAQLDPPRRRGGLEFRTVGYTLRGKDGLPLLHGKTTVLVVQPGPQPAGASGARRDQGGGPATAASAGASSGLPAVCRTITQSQLDAYCRVSGDHNPLHWDARFAAETQFGGIIAHGMLTLAFIAEMLALAFGPAWLESGQLKARFKGAARPGDRVQTWGRVIREDAATPGRRECAVGLCRAGTGEELISGAASVVAGGTAA
jgi:3-hydroxybutyryl-CoA dehydratase